MAKTSKPAIQKLKEDILNELDPSEQVELGSWFEDILAVREADRKAEERRKQRQVATGADAAPRQAAGPSL